MEKRGPVCVNFEALPRGHRRTMKGRRVLILGLVSGDEGKKSPLLWLSVVQAGVGRQPRRALCHCLRVSKGTPRGAGHHWPGRQCAYSLSGGRSPRRSGRTPFACQALQGNGPVSLSSPRLTCLFLWPFPKGLIFEALCQSASHLPSDMLHCVWCPFENAMG